MAKGFKNGLKKMGRVWYYKFKHQGTVYHGSTRCESFEDAQRWLRKFRDEISLRDQGIVDPPTVAKAFELYLRLNQTISSAGRKSMTQTMKNWVIPIIGEILVNKVTAEHLAMVGNNYMEKGDKRQKADQGRPDKPHTRGGLAKLLIDVRTLLNFCLKQKFVQALATKVNIPKVQQRPIQAMSASDVNPFLLALDVVTQDPQVRLAVRIMLQLGLRISEIITMRWEWFHGDFTVYIPGETKGREADGLPVPPDLVPMIRAWYQDSASYWYKFGHPRPDHVFFQKNRPNSIKVGGKKTDIGSFYRIYHDSFTVKSIKAAAKKAGLRGSWSPHRLRSSCATILGEARVGTTTIQRILRHKDIKTTIRYVKVTDTALRDAQERFALEIGGHKMEMT